MFWLNSAIFLLSASLAQGDSSVDCGRPVIPPNLDDSFYIVGGSEAKPHSWPWMVMIGMYGVGHNCGGSIINKRWVLTAAHCIEWYDAEFMSVGAGYHHLYVKDPQQKDYKIEKMIMHSNYGSSWRTPEDIALIKLASDIDFSDHVMPICLPSSGHQWSGKERYVVTGWGTLMENDPEENSSEVLMQVHLSLVPMETCNADDWYKGRIDPELCLCAGFSEGGRDTCQKDSGGPLVTYQGGRWVQAGVVSWGAGCGRPKRPGIYVNVAKFVPWIEETISKNSR